MKEQKKNCILQFKDGKEIELDYEIVQYIPTINNCVQDSDVEDSQIKIPLESTDFVQWQTINTFLPVYNEYHKLGDSVIIDPKDFRVIHYKDYIRVEHPITSKYERLGEIHYYEDEDYAKKRFLDKLQKEHKHKKLEKIIELHQLANGSTFASLVDLFKNADYLGMDPLIQISLLTITKLLQKRTHFEAFIQKFKNDRNFLNINAQNFIIRSISAVEEKKLSRCYFEKERVSGEPFSDELTYMPTNHSGEIVKICTKFRNTMSSYLDVYCYTEKKPKLKLFSENSIAYYNYQELLFLRFLKKEWQELNLQKARSADRESYWEREKEECRGYYVHRAKNSDCKVALCAKHTPELFEMYEAVKNKNSVVQTIVDARNCTEQSRWNIVGRVTYNKDLCVDEAHAKSIERNTKRKSLLVFSGLLSAGGLIHGLYNQNNAESAVATAALSGSMLGYFLMKDKKSDV